MHTFNYPQLIALLYACAFIIMLLYLMIYDDNSISLNLVLSAVWPLVLYFLCITKLLEIKDERKIINRVKARNFFKDTAEGKTFAKTYNINITSNTNRRGKITIGKVKKIHGKFK